ncbi:MAG: hypothetical protein AAB908_02665 [Patescibacteria group bacterium]
MNRFRVVMLAGYYSLALAFPLFVFGQTGAGLPKQIVPCKGVDCTVCDLATLAQNVINTGIFIFIFLAALLFAYAGFLYLTNEALDKQSEARKIFGNVAIGLVVLLAAWLVVDTLMKSVLGGDFGPWNDICRAVGI